MIDQSRRVPYLFWLGTLFLLPLDIPLPIGIAITRLIRHKMPTKVIEMLTETIFNFLIYFKAYVDIYSSDLAEEVDF